MARTVGDQDEDDFGERGAGVSRADGSVHAVGCIDDGEATIPFGLKTLGEWLFAHGPLRLS